MSSQVTENPGQQQTPALEKLEERADYIESKNLLGWNVENEFFRRIQSKLTGPGAKLLVAPRGCGKTHQMRVAFLTSIDDPDRPAPVYVSFTRYYHLEPFLHRSPIATRLFQTWVLAKIVDGTVDAARSLCPGQQLQLPFPHDEIRSFIELAEKGTIASDNHLVDELTLPKTIDVVESLLVTSKRKRVVLLLDDAALTLTPEYLVEFFDIFRSLKTRSISPKASIYPGTTEFGPRFHVGQDAEAVPGWLGVNDKGYSAFLGELVQARFEEELRVISPQIVELLKYAAFGVPRALIVLLRHYSDLDRSSPQEKFNASIEQQASNIETEYRSLGKKLPQYKTVIETGWEFFRACSEEIVKQNLQLADHRQITLGLAEETNHKLRKMLRFLLETGLMYELPSVRHGEDRRYERYIPHLLFLIKDRAFNTGRGFNAERVVENLRMPDAKHPVRRSFASLLGEEKIGGLRLDSPPCQKCGSGRLSDEQRFCHNCGTELSNPSAFEACMELSIEELPIPSYQLENLRQQGIAKIGDFYTRADPGTKLREAHLIGPVRSDQIYRAAKRVVEEFLER
jgi:hypothetical protein